MFSLVLSRSCSRPVYVQNVDVPVNSRLLCAKTSAIDDAALIAVQTLV